MMNNYEFIIANPNLNELGYLKVIANLNDKHDRSAPSNFHWKILKCRMIIFSNSSILSCPDKSDVKEVHIIFKKDGPDYNHLTTLFRKFSLTPNGGIRKVTTEIYLMCFCYTMSAKLAPTWNLLAYNYFVNNRDFLTANGPQDGIKWFSSVDDDKITLRMKPVKINFIRSKDKLIPGECVRVLPSLNKATIEEYHDSLPPGNFKCYKDLRRHWKNIHGYRLPEEEPQYYSVSFWRGDPLTYPNICLTTNFPNIIPMPKTVERSVLLRFINYLKNKMPSVLGMPLIIEGNDPENSYDNTYTEKKLDTQAVSLCTPTQNKTTNTNVIL